MPNFSRKDMPQVKTQDLGKALSMVADKVKVTKETIVASKLKKSQKELYKDKVQGIANRFTSPNKMKPLIISKDNHIVDGHHRWGAAIYKWGDDVKLNVHRIHLSAKNAIKLYKHIANTINEILENITIPIKVGDTVLSETMSIAARKKLARKSKSKLKKGMKKRIRKMNKKRSNDDLQKAAIRKAKTVLMQKMLKKSPADMTMMDKMKFSKMIAKKPGKIQKVAKKILPKLKQAESERVRKMKARNTQKKFESIGENITIPIKVGDTVLGGKFKNKRIVVKSIDKNEKGDITINGKPLLKYRLVNEANAVSGGKVHKFITGKNLTFKDKKYPNLYFEVLRIDNKSKLVTLKILSPKELFGKELDVPFKTIRRGPFLKTDTSVLGEGKIDSELESKYGVSVDVFEYPTHLELKRIVVPDDKRGMGIGTDVMNDLIKYAVKNNKDIFTTPSSDFGGTKSRLVKFYKSFGFKNNKGSKRDFRSRESMVRLNEACWKGYKQVGGKKKGGKMVPNCVPINEIPMADLQKIDTFADKKLNPMDVVITDKHFFDRLNDPRNGKEISAAELIGFFKRLSKKKSEFVEFLNQYNSIVATDDRTNINIPFMKKANKAIAKTVMRKKDFKTPDKKLDI